MSAPIHPTMQQVAGNVRVLLRTCFQSAGVHRYDCHEPVKAAHIDLLPMKHSETRATALSQGTQREFQSELPTTTRCQRHNHLASTEAGLMCLTREAKRQGAKP